MYLFENLKIHSEKNNNKLTAKVKYIFCKTKIFIFILHLLK